MNGNVIKTINSASPFISQCVLQLFDDDDGMPPASLWAYVKNVLLDVASDHFNGIDNTLSPMLIAFLSETKYPIIPY